jgi:hypothetical protein
MTDFIDERLAKAEARTPRLVKALDESSTVATDSVPFDDSMKNWAMSGYSDTICGCGHQTADHSMRGDCTWKDCHNAER